MPLVSVVVPNYNHESFLEQRIDSIINQTFQDFEIILLDDASTDGSLQILNSYANHPKVSEVKINKVNSGSPFKQWQKGIELAKGEYIWIAESDDFASVDFLDHSLKQLKNGANISYVQSIDVDENGVILSNRKNYTTEFHPNIWENDFVLNGNEFIKKYLAEKNVIPNASAVLFEKSHVKPIFFTEELLKMKMCGDWFFWLQFSENTTLAFISKPLNYFRVHKNVSRKQKSILKKKQRILEEVVCRNYLYKRHKISIPSKNKVLIDSWCKLHSKWAPFKKEFYEFKLYNIHSISLLLRFISVKLKSK
jgi:glycosyltransferase involved in cell wall biosynthesis